MNRISAYQNASAVMSYLVASNIGTIVVLDVFTFSVELAIHLPHASFVVDDVQELIRPYLYGNPKVSTYEVEGMSVTVLHVIWDDID